MTTTTPTSADQNSLREIMREFISACHDAGLSANVIEPPAGDRPQVRVQAPDTPGFMADVGGRHRDAVVVVLVGPDDRPGGHGGPHGPGDRGQGAGSRRIGACVMRGVSWI